MNVKIDTKEKFSVLKPEDSQISANMTDKLIDLLHSFQKKDPPHVILNLAAVHGIDSVSAEKIATCQAAFYENNQSFVVCNMQPKVTAVFDDLSLTDIMNITPSESEAWDIVQMEEIERELLGDFDENTPE